MSTYRAPSSYRAIGLLLVCVSSTAGSESVHLGHPVARVERSEQGNLVLRHATWLIHLHPDDFDTFSPHVGKWVERSVSGYRENTADEPPEAIKPGNIFSTSGIRLIRVLPDPGLQVGVELGTRTYTVDEKIRINVNLRNVGGNVLRLSERLFNEPGPRHSVQIVVRLKKIGRWDRPRFYEMLASKDTPVLLPAGKSLDKKDLDITSLADGPGRYRVSATKWVGKIPVCAPFLDFTIEPRGDEDEQHAHQHVDPVKD